MAQVGKLKVMIAEECSQVLVFLHQLEGSADTTNRYKQMGYFINESTNTA